MTSASHHGPGSGETWHERAPATGTGELPILSPRPDPQTHRGYAHGTDPRRWRILAVLLVAIFMSLVVYAGSAQLAVLPLMAMGSPMWVVWFTAACVNLRFVILSSMWRSYFAHLPLWHRLCIGYFSGDVIFVAFMRRYTAPVAKPQQVYYFWGASSLNFVTWQGFSIAGILLANVVPLEWGLGFAGVLALLGVLYSMLIDRATKVAALVAATAAIAAYGIPLKLNILVAIACAVTIGLLVEAVDQRGRKPKLVVVAKHTPLPSPGPEQPDDAFVRGVLRAFQLHFRPADYSGRLDSETAAILYALVERYPV